MYSTTFDVLIKISESLSTIEPNNDCIANKYHKSSFPSTTSYRASNLLHLVYGDICRPITSSTLGWSKYFLLLVDDFAKIMWLAMEKHKIKVFQPFFKFKKIMQFQEGSKDWIF